MVAWGSMIPSLYVLLTHWDAFTLSALRYALATPIMIGLTRWREGRLPIPPVRLWPRLALLGAVGIGGLATFYTVGLALADPVRAIVIQAASPLVSALVAWWFFGVPRERGMGSGLALASLGALLVMWPGGDAGPGLARMGFPVGEAFLLVGSVCWAWYSLACQRWLAGESQLRITTWTFVPAAGALGMAYLVARGLGATRAGDPGGRDLALIAWLTIAVTCLGVFLWNLGVSRLGLPRSALYLNAVPVFGVLIAAAFGVVPTGRQLVGGGLVLLGVAQAQVRRMMPAPGR